MDLRQLEMFKTVADLGGFTRASEKLHVSHSAISRQVKLLEEELGRLLFTRENKRVAMTEEGKVLLVHVDVIRAQLAEAVKAVSQVGHRPLLRIGTGTSMLHLFLSPIVTEFRGEHPTVNVRITTGHTPHILEQICTKDIDIGVVTLPADVRGLSVTPLYREEIVIAMQRGHPLSSRKSVRPEQLAGLPMIVFPKGSSTRVVLDRFFQETGVTPFIQMEVENEEAAERAAAAGSGVCFLARARAVQDRMPYLRIEGHPIYRDIAFVCAPPLLGLAAELLASCQMHLKSTANSTAG
jgi:DNA-binding transcriptional LysR family regulator